LTQGQQTVQLLPHILALAGCSIAGSGGSGGFILCQVKWHFCHICWHHAKKQSEKDDENQTERRK
jgi:hypothetical protein